MKLVEDKNSDSKAEVREAEAIKLAHQPSPETYGHWKNAVREEIRAASDKPDKAWEWLREVYDKDVKRAEKSARLHETGLQGLKGAKAKAACGRARVLSADTCRSSRGGWTWSKARDQ